MKKVVVQGMLEITTVEDAAVAFVAVVAEFSVNNAVAVVAHRHQDYAEPALVVVVERATGGRLLNGYVLAVDCA